MGFEPTNNGFANRRSKNAKPVTSRSCKTTKRQLTPQLTPEEQKQADSLPPDLTQIVTAWPELPKYIKGAIKALVREGYELDNDTEIDSDK